MSMMTGEELETLLDVTNASLQNWKKSGMPYEIDGNKHYYNLDTTLRWIHDNGMSKQRFTRYKLERAGEETAFGTLDEISEQTGILRTTLIAYKTRKKTHIKNSKISMLEYDKKEVMKIVANIENRKVNSNMDNKKSCVLNKTLNVNSIITNFYWMKLETNKKYLACSLHL